MLLEDLLVDPGLVVEALGVARGHQLDQVVPPLARLGEKHQMVVLAASAALREPAARRDVDLAAENRLDPARTRVIVKDDGREEVAVLGDRHRRHLLR